MLNINKDGFKIEIYDKKIDDFFGEIKHSELDSRIMLKEKPDILHEKYGIHCMSICNLQDSETTLSAINLNGKLPKELVELLLNNKAELKNFFDKHSIIEMDTVSMNKLIKKDLFTKCILYHELGHFMNKDIEYNELPEDRITKLYENKVSKKELDADLFGYSVFNDEYYNALKDDYIKTQEAIPALTIEEDKLLFTINAIEMQLRLEFLTAIIKKDKFKNGD